MLFTFYRAPDRFGESLELGEFCANSLRSVTINRTGQNICEAVTDLDHSLTRLQENGWTFVHRAVLQTIHY